MNDLSNISTLASTITQGLDNRLKELHTATPGIIESFSPGDQLASVQPAIKRVFINRENNESVLLPRALPLLVDVPVIFPRGGGFSLTFPVAPGDECLLVFCERTIDDWHQSGVVSAPGGKRFHSLNDAICFVGLSSKINKIPNYNANNAELKRDDGTVTISLESGGKIKIKADVKVVIDCPEASFSGDVKVSGDMQVSGNVKIKKDATVDGNVQTTGSVSAGGGISASAGSAITSGGNLKVDGKSEFSEKIFSAGKNIGANHSHKGPKTAPSGPVSDTGKPI